MTTQNNIEHIDHQHVVAGCLCDSCQIGPIAMHRSAQARRLAPGARVTVIRGGGRVYLVKRAPAS